MSDSEEISRTIDVTYKNLLEKFNPAARQIITAGKAYLKALHGASASSKAYLDAISKLSSQVRQSPTGVSADIGTSLEQIVDVYKEIQCQQSNILKSFYVDFIVPLEANLDKDGKVLQTDHKKFLTNQKFRHEALAKAENNVRKQKKKKIGGKNSIDKEIKSFQLLDEERTNFETFLDQSFTEVTHQERRRYSFVLERLCVLGRHHLALYSKGSSLLQKHLDDWTSISNANQLMACPQPPVMGRGEAIEGIYSTPGEENEEVEVTPLTPLRRRSQSLDGFLSDGSPEHQQRTKDPQTHGDYVHGRPLSKAKSEYSLDHCQNELHVGQAHSRRSVVISERRNLARAAFTFHASADNQLTFEEGDVITLIGEKSKGWQYGENQRTQKMGWFPVAYTEPLEDVDSAIGYSYNNSPPSSHSKLSADENQEKIPSLPPSRGQSLDRLDNNCQPKRKVRARSTPSDISKRSNRQLPLRSTSPPPRQVLIEEEKGQTYYSIRPPSTSCGDSENKKTIETYNSHIFLNQEMEEDLNSYEGSYRNTSSRRRYPDKYTNFGAENSLSNSLCRSLTSPELPACFRKSDSSIRDSTHCSEDSGFSKEDHNNKRSSTSSYTESCSKSCASSWVTGSYDICNSVNEDCYSRCCNEEKGSPTFLKYLYPSYKDSFPSIPTHHSSAEELNAAAHYMETKKDHWIVNAFGTLGKKKKNFSSPCAQKIASQKARKKNARNPVRRSSSLLCIDMVDCTSSQEEAYTSNYEDITYAAWHQVPKVEIQTNRPPPPPPYDPPPLPVKSDPVIGRQRSRHQLSNVGKLYYSGSKEPASLNTFESSSGNSSWSESEGSCMEAYMVVKDFNKDTPHSSDSQISDKKRCVTRSYTWASPDTKIPLAVVKTTTENENNNSDFYEDKKLKCKTKNSFRNPFSASPFKAKEKSDNYEKTAHTNQLNSNIRLNSSEYEDFGLPPPLPPRKTLKPAPNKTQKDRNKDINILNYSEYMCHRLTNPDGTCRFDQRSFTTGQKCSAWYDLWGIDPSVENLV